MEQFAIHVLRTSRQIRWCNLHGLKWEVPSPHPDFYAYHTSPRYQRTFAISLRKMWPGLSGHYQMFLLGVQMGHDHSIQRIWPTSPMLRSPLSSMLLRPFLPWFWKGKFHQSLALFGVGTTLFALEKKGDGIRPMALGWIIRRLVAKIAGNMVVEDMVLYWLPGSWVTGLVAGRSSSPSC